VCFIIINKLPRGKKVEKGAGIIREKKRKINKSFQLILLMILVFIPLVLGGCPKTSPQRAVSESSRDIPVAYDVDVVVVGGTSGGVAAAVEAAQNGVKVFLAAERPYLGADICATYRLWLEPGEVPALPTIRQCPQRYADSIVTY